MAGCGKKINYVFLRNNTHASPIDCFINYNKIQCKVTENSRSSFGYSVSIGKYNEVNKREKPYSFDDDIDFFIIEIGQGKEQFFIIPFSEMIKHGLIKTEKNNGKLVMHVLPRFLLKNIYSVSNDNRISILLESPFTKCILYISFSVRFVMLLFCLSL